MIKNCPYCETEKKAKVRFITIDDFGLLSGCKYQKLVKIFTCRDCDSEFQQNELEVAISTEWAGNQIIEIKNLLEKGEITKEEATQKIRAIWGV